ncbi:MAG TPA: hypothetical protein VFL59_14765 [Candidatus Nanopelagicales bacterium]|nr:hypothetical protein [Candidatus Nanopelagicales bacterium]
MTTVESSARSTRRGTALVVAGPVLAVALFLLVLAGLNWWFTRHPTPSDSASIMLSLVALVAVPLMVGGAVAWRGLVLLHVPNAALRLVVALVVVLGGAALIGVLLWLAGLNIQQGSAS